jgi:serine/threonine protein kinase
LNNGEIIGGRYRLDRKIGQGGTGRIWLAHDGRLDRRVAIKFLLAHTAAHRARLAKRVSLEAKIAASIQHRNVIQIFDFGTHEANIPYIVMEALSGFTLGEAFDEARRFSLDTLIHIMTEVLRGLSAVHDAGIVHRDIKPENIFLVQEARGKLSPKLLDFGISRSLEPDMRPSAVTTTEGMILGTPEYMSPEQARGDSDIDKRTDIYSIATIMFEAFAGGVPFPATSITELLIAVIQRNAPPLYALTPQIGQALCSVVDKALAKDRNQRYAHAEEMLDAVVAAALEIPAELDRNVAVFPPDTIRNRAQRRSDDETEEPASAGIAGSRAPAVNAVLPHSTPETVQEPGIQRRGKRAHGSKPSEHSFAGQSGHETLPLGAADGVTSRLQLALPRAVWLTFAALAAFGLTLAAVVTLLDHFRAPEGSGLIVVQAPSSNPAPHRAPAEPTPPPGSAAATGDAVLLDVRVDPPPKKAAGAKAARKPAPADPLQLMAASVAEAFSKQKASVIACLIQHAADIEGTPQLKVRLLIGRNGVASDTELLPAAISNKPVAGCLRAAVTNMSFPRPEQPTTFSVPLVWRRK